LEKFDLALLLREASTRVPGVESFQSEYAQRFADNGIDLSVIRDLTEQDLKDLGVLLGHRRRILRAIAELGGVAAAPTETATEPALRDEPERRHLTVMICDLVGSTALSTRLDPEDMRAVIDAYHAACARITRTYDGFLAEFRGDGILAYSLIYRAALSNLPTLIVGSRRCLTR
jgi:class 3 adenylate cyclase